MKSYTITGQANTRDGYALCLDCYDNSLASRTEDSSAWHSIFAGDEDWENMSCDDCLQRLGDTV